MILGYEQPVSIPGMEIYDKDTMRMYLSALLRDYEQGVADLKEFIKNYGDFISIMPGATDAYYNAGMRGINDTYDRLMQQGIDPIRSVQGREAMARARMGANTKLMANIKADSAAYELYQKAAGTLAANGKFDKNLNDWWLKQNGIDPNNWDFNGNKRWDVISPLLATTIQELLAPTTAELAKTAYEKDPLLSKDGRRVDVVKRSSIDAALNKGIDDLLKDPRMLYYYQTSGLSKEDFLRQLGGHIEGVLRPKETEDKYWFSIQDLANKRAQLRLQQAAHAETVRHNKATESLNLLLTDKIAERTMSKTIGDNTKSNVNPSAFVNYFKNLANSTKNSNHKSIYTKYANEWSNYSKMNDKQKDAFLKKYGYIDNAGLLTSKYYEYYGNATNAFRGNSVQSRDVTITNSMDNYSKYMSNLNNYEVETALQAMSGQSKRGKNGYYQITFGNGVLYTRTRALDFSGLTKSSIPRNKDVSYLFGNWLSKSRVTGNAFDSSGLQAGRLPGNVLEFAGLGTTVKKSKIDEFLKIARTNHYRASDGKSCSGKTDAQILSDLGLAIVTADGTPVTTTTRYSGNVKDGENVAKDYSTSISYKQDNAYVVIPTSSSINAIGTNLSGINDAYNKDVFGSGSAYKEILNSLLSSEQF